MANQETFLRGLKINEKPLFPETVSPTDKLEHKLENGTVIRAVAEGSRIVGYTAHDSAGKSIPVFRLSMTDASPPEEESSEQPIASTASACRTVASVGPNHAAPSENDSNERGFI